MEHVRDDRVVLRVHQLALELNPDGVEALSPFHSIPPTMAPRLCSWTFSCLTYTGGYPTTYRSPDWNSSRPTLAGASGQVSTFGTEHVYSTRA